MIYSLQSLRVVFALCIFFHHLDLFEAGGSCGVSFFLVLSGFVLAAGYGERAVRPDFVWKAYMQKRMARLLPLHWLTLLLALWVHGVLRGEQLSAGPLVANVLLLQSWFPWYGYFFSGNAVSWYLSDLMFFYAVFPLLMKGWGRVRRRYWLWGSGSLLLFVLYGLFQARLPELYGNQLFVYPSAVPIAGFRLGCVHLSGLFPFTDLYADFHPEYLSGRCGLVADCRQLSALSLCAAECDSCSAFLAALSLSDSGFRCGREESRKDFCIPLSSSVAETGSMEL